jgi:hypothetical protein
MIQLNLPYFLDWKARWPATLLLYTVFFCLACADPDSPEFGILVKNDIRDETYNVIRIDNVKTKNGRKWLSFNLSPGDRHHITYKNITALRFSRRYARYTQYYEVECPGGLSKGVAMKLIDVHLGRIAGGCKTVNMYRQ